jgi:geranylgeranyl pyrophosphate synthase
MNKFWEMIGNFKEDFRRDMEFIEKKLVQSIPDSEPSMLYKASKHLVTTGGKRVRPALLTLSFKAVNRTDKGIEYIIPIAVAVELIHTATIIHDDIIDRSSMRRGVETVNRKWGNDVAVLAGDLIFSKAFGMVGTHENKEVSEIISNACMKLAEGEVLETLHTGNTKMTEEVYLEIIERKTATLFEASTKCGAILGRGAKKEVDALSKYGYFIGIGFQMTDDVLDITAGETKLGKPVGIDISLGKSTFVILHAITNAGEEDKKILEGVIQRKENTREEVKRALDIIKETDSLEYASKRASSFIKKAKRELKSLKDSDAKKALELIADYAINRQF